MSRLFAYLVRFAIIIFGYLCAALAASAFLNLMIIGSEGLSAEELPYAVTGSIILAVPLTTLLVAYFAFIPALPLILLGEFMSKRDWLFYAIGGAIISLVLVGVFLAGGGGKGGAELSTLASAKVGAGIVAGIAYWLIAGRTAGMWLERPTAPERSES